MTKAEVILWQHLRRNAIKGGRFRRQHPIGPFIADFACAPLRLVIEVDGATHASDRELDHDRRRDLFLRRQGWRVVRIRNDDIRTNLDRVLEMIASLVPPPPA